MTRWICEVDGVEEPNQFHVSVKDTANPFGDVAVVSIHDESGTRFDAYGPGTPIELFVNTSDTVTELLVSSGNIETVAAGTTDSYGGVGVAGQLNVGGQANVGEESTTNVRFPGFVADRTEREENGNDILDVTVHTYDQLLRGEVVQEDLSGQTITSALETIVKEYTPVTWVAGNVNVSDDKDLSRSFRGEKVENALIQLSFKSAAEGFGVNQDIEFFFEPIEANPAPRDVGPAEIFDVEIEEDARAAPNEVTVFYDDGNQSVTVDRGDEKLLRQEQLGTDRPVTKAVEISRDNITTIDDARDAGEKYLEDRASRFRGVVTTYDLFTAEIGEVINVRSVSKDLDDDYRIAAIEYNDVAETRVTIIDQRTDQDERLVNFGDSLDRVATRNADRDAVRNRVTNTDAQAEFLASATAGSSTVGGSLTRVVNTARTKVRDAWIDGTTISVSEIAVGDDATGLNRTNEALGNETERVSVSETLPDAKTVEYSGTLSQIRDVAEVGLFDSAGDLVARAVFDPSVSTDSVSLKIVVDNDASVPKAVITDAGQTATRDILADNSPKIPGEYAYGSDGTDPTTADTALGTEVVSQSVEELQIQEAATATEWGNVTSIADTDPLTTANGQLELLQSAWTQPDEDSSATEGSVGFINDSKYTGGSALQLTDTNDAIEWTFTVDYTIPEADFEIYVLMESTSGSGFISHTWSLSGPTSGQVFSINNTGGDIFYDWENITGGDLGSPEWNGGDITPGTYTLRVDSDGSTGDLVVDGVAPLDGRYSYTFDSTSGDKSGPELYPDQVVTSFNTATTTRDVSEASFTSTWNDTSGSQYIEIANDGSTFTRFDNSSSGSVTFAGPETGVDTNVSLSRFGSSGSTPTSGVSGQTMDDWDLFADLNAVSPADIDATDTQIIIPPDTITGTTVREGGIKASDGTLLTRSVFAGIDIEANVQLVSSERTVWQNQS